MTNIQNEYMVKKLCSVLHQHVVHVSCSKSDVNVNKPSKMGNVTYSLKKARITKEYLRLKEIERASMSDSEEPPPIFASTRRTIEAPKLVEQTASEENIGSPYSVTMLLTNLFIFVFSLVFCSIAKFFATIICKFLRGSKEVPASQPKILEPLPISPMIGDYAKEPLNVTASESAIGEKKILTVESSCPNLTVKLGRHQTCQTLFHSFSSCKQEIFLKAECAKLREEIMCLHANSIKEHALLSRKLDSMAKEKRELSKRLTIVQKENQVAKNQLDELMEEKKMLQKKLENATKEFRVNTKTKKVALAKLEEISVTVDDLKRQLEQVTRDKQILQGKLEVLRNEYEQMQDRMRIMQLKEAGRMSEERTMAIEMDKAEKEDNLTATSGDNLSEQRSACHSSQSSLDQNVSKESVFLPYVISQTEVDMKNIQMKIAQLEKSLKEFSSCSDFRTETVGEMKAELDVKKSLTRPEKVENPEIQVTSSPSSPRIITPRNDVTCRKTYDEIKVQILRSALREKIKILENMKERGDESTTGAASEATTVEEEFEMSSEECVLSQRIVSNSLAFQKFLKNIGAEAKRVPIGDSKCNPELSP
ncbi:hypothetical protein HHI36_008291 [Cryptolaemus montrouzieri]|uniref:Uncharacterized protein n=1 Tax=Cryptolaemus montrouzieri TaxID=559131 RepID=A0ABD2MSV2_9CUCU